MKFVKNENFGCEPSKKEHLVRFANSQGLPDPIKVPIRRSGVSGSGDPHQCHTNSLLMADRYGGRVLVGLGFSSEHPNSIVVVGHSVWISPEGKAVCLTLNSSNPQIRVANVDFIPLWVYDEDDFREFFEENKELRVPSDYLVTSDLSHLAVPSASIGFELGQYLSKGTRNQRRQLLKKNKDLVGSGRGSVLRQTIDPRSHKSPAIDFKWFLETQEQNFLRGKSSRLAEVA